MPHNKMVREPEQKKPLTMLKAFVSETSINTFKEANIQTPVSASYFQAMRVHKVVLASDTPDLVEDVFTNVQVALYTQSRLTMPGISDPGLIALFEQQRRWVSSAAGGESDWLNAAGQHGAVWDFGEQGILVTDAVIHIAVKGFANTGVKTGRVIVYYTLETLEPDEYVAALTTLGADL